MASKLSEQQVAEIAEAVRSVGDIKEPSGLHALVRALAESPQTAFSAADLDGVGAAARALEQPLADRPVWKAARGRGQFFVFEGLDRSGKSTQSRLLREHLDKEVGREGSVKWMCFPERATPIGSLIDLYLRRQIELGDGAVHLLFSANRWELSRCIVEELNKGVTVVCDRYAFSGVAYSAAKGLDFEWCQAPDRGLPCPDGVFFLRVDPEVGAQRANFGDERYENAEMQAAVRAEFQRPELHSSVDWRLLDASRSIDDLHAEIWEHAQSLAQADQENGAKPIKRLWL